MTQMQIFAWGQVCSLQGIFLTEVEKHNTSLVQVHISNLQFVGLGNFRIGNLASHHIAPTCNCINLQSLGCWGVDPFGPTSLNILWFAQLLTGDWFTSRSQLT